MRAEGMLKTANSYEYKVVLYEEVPRKFRLDLIEPDENGFYPDYDMFFPDNVCASLIRDSSRTYWRGNQALIKVAESVIATAKRIIAKQSQTIAEINGEKCLKVEKINGTKDTVYTRYVKGPKTLYEFFKVKDNELYLNDYDSAHTVIKPMNLDTYRIRKSASGNVEIDSNTQYLSYEQIMVLYPEMEKHLDKDWVVANSLELAEQRLKQWIEFDCELKAVDIETTDKLVCRDGPGEITSILLGYVSDDLKTESSTLFPIKQDNFSYNLPREWIDKIMDAIQNQPRTTKILAHYAKMEYKGFYHATGRILRVDADTHQLSIIANPKFKGKYHGLKQLGEKYRNEFFLELEHVFIKKKNIKFNTLPEDVARIYACPDVTTPCYIYRELMKEVPTECMFALNNIHYPIIKVKAIQEYEGMQLNMPYIDKKINECSEKMETISENLIDLFEYPGGTNINSPDIKRDIIYNKLGLPVKHWTAKDMKPATNKDVYEYWLKKLEIPRDERRGDIPDMKTPSGLTIVSGKELAKTKVIPILLLDEYRKYLKELGAFNRLKKKSVDGRFMFYINAYGAETTRQTSDAQQMSYDMKKAVVPFNEEFALMSADYSQIELRVLPYLAGETRLIELEKNPDNDVHRIFLGGIQGKEVYQITSEDRSKGKSVNFGIVYGKTAYGLARDRKGDDYTEDDVVIAKQDILDFLNAYPKIKNFLDLSGKYVQRHGEIYTRWGDRRVLKEALEEGLSRREQQGFINKGMNTPVQGFAAGVLKLAEIYLFNRFFNKYGKDYFVNVNGKVCPKIHLMVSVHDEVLVQIHKSIPLAEAIDEVISCMDIHIKGAPPFFTCPAIVPNWADGKEAKYEIPIKLRDDIISNWRKDKTEIINYDNCIDTIRSFKKSQIETYMQDLIKKYKTVDEIAKHVKHPSHTHTLIDTIPQSVSGLDQDERIRLAVECYMNSEDVQEILSTSEEEAPRENIDDFDLSSYMNFDEDGNIELEEFEDEDDFQEVIFKDTKEESKEMSDEIQEIVTQRGIFMKDSVLVDVSMVPSYRLKELDKKIREDLSDVDGGYEVQYFKDDTVIPANFKINANRMHLSKLVHSMEVINE